MKPLSDKMKSALIEKGWIDFHEHARENIREIRPGTRSRYKKFYDAVSGITLRALCARKLIEDDWVIDGWDKTYKLTSSGLELSLSLIEDGAWAEHHKRIARKKNQLDKRIFESTIELWLATRFGGDSLTFEVETKRYHSLPGMPLCVEHISIIHSVENYEYHLGIRNNGGISFPNNIVHGEVAVMISKMILLALKINGSGVWSKQLKENNAS